jgi:hypothetical protein
VKIEKSRVRSSDSSFFPLKASVTGVCEKNRPKCSPTHYFSKLIYYIHWYLNRGKSSPRNCASSVIKKANIKQPTNSRKCTQSCHPAQKLASLAIWCVLRLFSIVWYILWIFGIYFLQFGKLYQEKSGNPAWVTTPLAGNKSTRKATFVVPTIVIVMNYGFSVSGELKRK